LAVQLRSFGGCYYTCEVITDGPWNPFNSITFGVAKFTGPQINAACGPGKICPHLLTIEVDNPGLGLHDAKILSCVM